MENRFKLDQLISNCDYIIKFCSKDANESNKLIIENCDQLLKSAEYVDKIAYEYTFENLPTNGFVIYLKIITSYTGQIVKQIETKNKINENFGKIFKIIMTYKKLILFMHKTLVDKEPDKSGKNKTLVDDQSLSSMEIYDMINSNDDITPIYLSRYPGFWLPNKIQKFLKFFNFCFAIAYKLPFSLATLYSRKSFGKYTYNAFKNATLDYPFSVWHETEGFFMSTFVNYLINRKIPVKSVTIRIPKQYRFRLHYKGDFLDFEQMTNDEIESYFNDEHEQERQNSPGKRHRNREAIECRYTYITSKEKVIESLDQIKNTTTTFKKMKMFSARKLHENETKRFPPNNEVERLNIYETKDFVKKKLKLKNQKIKNADYSGPRYSDHLIDKEFKEIPLQNGNSLVATDEFDLNPEKVLVIYIHGGGFITQGPRSCEIFLRDIVNRLGGVPILGVHYSLTVPFPVATQEILDVYLWALSRKGDVKETLGFHPKKIIIFGDSAGGYYGVSLAIMLNELNKKFALKLPLPNSIVLCYPVLGLTTNTPSRALSPLEPLIAFQPLFLVLAMFGSNACTNGDFRELENNESYQQFIESNKHSFAGDQPVDDSIKKKRISFKKENSRPFFHCDYSTYNTRMNYVKQFYENPIITPISYEHFDELSTIDLYTISGELDFLVDDSIEISNKWKGNVSLDIVNDLMHGYFYFNQVTDICKEATDLSVKRIQEACGF